MEEKAMQKGFAGLRLIALLIALALLCFAPGFGATSDVDTKTTLVLAPPGSARKKGDGLGPDRCCYDIGQGTGPPVLFSAFATTDVHETNSQENNTAADGIVQSSPCTDRVGNKHDLTLTEFTKSPGPPGYAQA